MKVARTQLLAPVNVDELLGIVEFVTAVDTAGAVDVFINGSIGRADAGGIALKETPEMKR